MKSIVNNWKTSLVGGVLLIAGAALIALHKGDEGMLAITVGIGMIAAHDGKPDTTSTP